VLAAYVFSQNLHPVGCQLEANFIQSATIRMQIFIQLASNRMQIASGYRPCNTKKTSLHAASD
jgi:hypothetical protein